MTDPLKEIEEAKGQHDLGVTAYRVYRGARDEGASRREAFMVVVAFFRGALGAIDDNEDEDDDGGEP